MKGTVRGPAAHGRRLASRIGTVAAIALAVASIEGVATARQAEPTRDTAPEDPSVATTILRHIDLNSFSNSTGPRRQAALHTPSDYGLTKIESFDDGWAQASEPGDGWFMSVVVLDGRARAHTICFNDTGGKGATYRTTQALRVTLDPSGRWEAVPVGDQLGCKNDPASGIVPSPPPARPHRVDGREASRLVRAAAAARRAAGSAPRARPDLIRLGAEDDRSFTFSVHAAGGCPQGERVCSALIGHFRVDKATGIVIDADREPE